MSAEIAVTVHPMIIFLQWRFTLLHTLPRIPYIPVNFFNAACWLLLIGKLTVTLYQAIAEIHETRLAVTCCPVARSRDLDTSTHILLCGISDESQVPL